MRIFILIIAVVLSSTCKAQTSSTKLIINKDDNSLLWQISGNGLKEPSYLFGTFHLLCKDDIHFSNQLDTAFAHAKEIYMELNMSDPSTISGSMQLMYMHGNKKLKDFYTDSEYTRLKNYFADSLQMPLDFFATVKPIFATAFLYPKMLGCTSISGPEEELLALAKKEKKQIQGLETIEFQAAVFDSIPYAEQAKELLKTIDSINSYKKEFDTLLNAYKTQAISNFENLFTKSESGMDEHEDILLDNRNKTWVSKLKKIMAGDSIFIAVGAGHLVGPKGLIELLRKEGYTVVPLLNK